eukprot:XP_001710119.1 Hypothetical protein GL50803_95602 [Giardia lamblia ATCC 50803]
MDNSGRVWWQTILFKNRSKDRALFAGGCRGRGGLGRKSKRRRHKRRWRRHGARLFAEGELSNRFIADQTFIIELVKHLSEAGFTELVRTRSQMEELRHAL